MPKVDRKAVYEKYGGRCAYCGRKIDIKDMQADHLKPQRQGGADEINNMMPSCRRCNHYKRANSLDVYRSMLMDMERKVLDTYLGRVARDYGMVEWKGWDGKFFFEKLEGGNK